MYGNLSFIRVVCMNSYAPIVDHRIGGFLGVLPFPPPRKKAAEVKIRKW